MNSQDILQNLNLVVYDIEVDRSFDDEKWWIFTPEKWRLIQLWAVKIQNWIIVEAYEDYILPEPWYMITDKVKDITWITDNDIRTWISEKEAIEKFLDFIWEDRFSVWLGWQNHINFDNVIINHVIQRIEKDFFKDYTLPSINYDTMHIARRIFWRWWNSNAGIAERMWIEIEDLKHDLSKLTWKDYTNAELHTALYDSFVTANNLLKLAEKHPKFFM